MSRLFYSFPVHFLRRYIFWWKIIQYFYRVKFWNQLFLDDPFTLKCIESLIFQPKNVVSEKVYKKTVKQPGHFIVRIFPTKREKFDNFWKNSWLEKKLLKSFSLEIPNLFMYIYSIGQAPRKVSQWTSSRFKISVLYTYNLILNWQVQDPYNPKLDTN